MSLLAKDEGPSGSEQMRYIYLASATFVVTFVFGIVAVWFEPNPWSFPLRPLSLWLIEFGVVKSRYEISVSFCGVCGDLYLVTLEFFLFLTLLYLCSLARWVLRREKRQPQNGNMRDSRRETWKVLRILLSFISVSMLIIWALLFSPGLARPSLRSPSNSDYSMFGFTLILLVNIAFHLLIFAVMAAFAFLFASSRAHRATSP